MPSARKLVREYVEHGRPRHRATLLFYQREKSLSKVIRQAAMAMLPNGKKHPHQWRLSNATLRDAADRLSRKVRAFSACRSFHDLFELVETTTAPLIGFGELAIYDTALRIGARLALSPTEVYLHAGTRKGCVVLGLTGAAMRMRLPRSEFPANIRDLPIDEIEDFMCIYKDDLRGGGSAAKGPRRPTTPRC
jgi:hypothetical protein